MKKTFIAALLLLSNNPLQAQPVIANGGFESWTVQTRVEPVGWKTNNTYSSTNPSNIYCTRVTGSSGYAIRLQSIASGGYIYPGRIDIGTPNGGLPAGVAFNGPTTPTRFQGMLRHGFAASDSGKINLVFRKSGAVIGRDTFYITGNQSTFSAFNFPLHTLPAIPDTVLLAASTGLYIIGGTAGDFLELDELALGNGTSSYPMQEGNFANWSTTSVTYANSWTTSGSAEQTTDRKAGSYAIKLSSKNNGNGLEAGKISSELIPINSNGQIDTLTGYYKYIASASDQAKVTWTMYNTQATQEDIRYSPLPTTANYLFFSIPLNNTVGANVLRFDFISSAVNPINGSSLFLDELKINGHPIATAVSEAPAVDAVQVYPNPANDVLHVRLGNAEPVKIVLFDATGSVLTMQSANRTNYMAIPLLQLKAGIYFYEIKQGTDLFKGTFTKY